MDNIKSADSKENNKTHTIKAKTINKNNPPQTQPVKIIDFDMPFGSMVSFMIKWVLASIPAMMILFAIGFILSMIAISIFGSIIMSTFTYN